MSWLLAIFAYASGIIFSVRGDTFTGLGFIICASLFTIAGNIAALNNILTNIFEKGERKNG